jgi:site-specific DNA-methyltransferase (adenine-specific)
MFEKMARYANEHGDPSGRPYFSENGRTVMTADDWMRYRAKFHCPMGYTNIWDRGALHGRERVKVPHLSAKAAHLNQKPLDLLRLIIEAATDPGDVVWEPFGGLFSASLAARKLGRRAYACELDPTYFQLGVSRFEDGDLF